MSQIMYVKLKNGQRQRKKNTRRDRGYYCLTPPKYTSKNSLINLVPKYSKKYGYDYKAGESDILRHAKEEFEQKMFKYLGNGQFARKIGRTQKHRRKQELNFKIMRNPILESFQNIKRITTQHTVKQAFQRMKKLFAVQE